MDHSSVRAIVAAEVIRLIAQKYKISLEQAMDNFYRSQIGAAFSEDETGLYGQSALFIFDLYQRENRNLT